MIEPNKLWQLDGGQRRRKLALTFGALERDIAGIAEKGHEYSFPSLKREEYTKKVVQVLLKDPALPEQDKTQLENALKNAAVSCYAIEGTYPPSAEYLIENYSVQVDEERFAVKYEFYGSNLMPDITVLVRRYE